MTSYSAGSRRSGAGNRTQACGRDDSHAATVVRAPAFAEDFLGGAGAFCIGGYLLCGRARLRLFSMEPNAVS
jgi:hypothetical protein